LRVASTLSTPRAPASPVDSHAGVKEHDEHTSSKYLRGGDFSHRPAGRHTSFASHSEPPPPPLLLQPPPSTCNCDGGTAPKKADLRACLDGCAGYATVKLGSGDFALGPPQYAIPKGTTIQGQGTDKTRIKAANAVWLDCNSDYDPSQKIGFILGDNTKIQDFTYISLDEKRFAMDPNKGGLCGGSVFEAPGCKTSDCKYGYKTLSHEKNDHISSAVISNIFITGQNSAGNTCLYNDWGNDDCKTAPQSSLFIPWSGNGGGCTNHVRMTGVTMLKSWADGFNVHGCAHDIHVNHNTLWQASV